MISEQLILDASEADQTIAQIDQQLQQAAELFKVALADALDILSQPIIAQVEADTQPAETEIAALADAPPVDIPVAADTAEAEQLILALGDQPPVDIPVDADTALAQDALTTLAGSAPPIDMLVEADTSGAEQSVTDLGTAADHSAGETSKLTENVGLLGAAAGVAEGSAKELVATVGELGGEAGGAAATGVLALAAATAGFFTEGLGAVSAGQRFDLVLGDMANKVREIDVNGLHTSMEELGLQFGSTGAEMENANSKLFQFAINAGATKDKAVEFAQQVETLSARAISLNPQLGTLSSVTETLGPKLARGGRFAAEFGLALTPAEIGARALADTGKSLTSELTVQEKAMAGAQIASERYGSTLAGTVAEGSKNAAVQAESLKARFKEAIEQIGVPIVAPVLDIIQQAEPDAILIAEALGQLAHDVLPAVAAALAVIGPPLQLVAFILDQIPAGAIAGAAAFFIFRAAMEAVAVAAIADEAALFALSTAIPWIAVAGAAIVALTSFLGSAPPFVDDLTRAVDSAAKGFDDFDTSVHDVIKSELEAASKTGDFAKRLSDANVSTDDLNTALLAGGAAYGQYEARILAAAIQQDASLDTIGRLINELDHLGTATLESAKRTLDNAVNTGKLSAAERDAAIAKSGLVGEHKNYVAALDIVQPKLKAAAEAEAEQAKAQQDAADTAAALTKAMDGLAASAPAVSSALDAVLNKTGGTAESLLALATTVDGTKLSTDELAAIAQALGVSVDELTKFAKDGAAVLNDFVSTGLKGLPDLSSAIDDVLNPKAKPDKPIIIDPAKLQAEIDADIEKIRKFNEEIANLHAFGLDNLARVAAQKGPEFTAALSEAIKKGDVAQVLDAKFGELNQVTRDEPAKLREAGAGIIVATGEIADLASKDFAGKFDVVTPTADQLGKARVMAAQQGIPLADALQIVGAQAAAAFAGSSAFGALPSTTADTMISVGDAIGSNAPTAFAAGGTAGAGTAGEFVSALAAVLAYGVPPSIVHVGDLISGAVPLIGAHDLGIGVGTAFADGFAGGVGASIGKFVAAAEGAVGAAVSAAKAKAKISSPSRVMFEIGQQMAAGLALGLGEADGVAAAGADLIAAAVAPVPSLSTGLRKTPVLSIMSPSASPEISTTYRPPSTFGGPIPESLFRDLVVQVDASGMTRDDARKAGREVGGAVMDRLSPLAARRLVVGTKVS